MDPMGLRFDFADRHIVCDVSGSMQTREKKLQEFLSIMCFHLGNPSLSYGYKRFVGDQQSFSDFCEDWYGHVFMETMPAKSMTVSI